MQAPCIVDRSYSGINSSSITADRFVGGSMANLNHQLETGQQADSLARALRILELVAQTSGDLPIPRLAPE